MDRQKILIPRGTLPADEINRIAADLFSIGYTVRKVSVLSGEHKGAKYIEYWIDGKGKEDVRACEAGGGERRRSRDVPSYPDTGETAV